MKWNPKYNLWAIIAFIVLLIVIVVVAYFRGKRNATGPAVTYPQGGSTIPLGWSPVPLADALHDVMAGLFTFSGTKDTTWQKLVDLPTDEMVIAVYNAFNKKYFSEGNGTLTKWIESEKYYDYTTGVKQAAIARLNAAKCYA